jgi:hypothetical protein
MGRRSWKKSSDATTPARADRGAAFKKCCLRTGRYDGSPRAYYV